MRHTLALALWPATAVAEAPLTGAEFAAHVGTNTFSYGNSSGARGTADYGPGRRLLWAFESDRCMEGRWYADGSEICFVYPDGALSAFRHFFLDDNRLRGVATRIGSGKPAALDIFEIPHSDRPLRCAGPDMGV